MNISEIAALDADNRIMPEYLRSNVSRDVATMLSQSATNLHTLMGKLSSEGPRRDDLKLTADMLVEFDKLIANSSAFVDEDASRHLRQARERVLAMQVAVKSAFLN